MWILAQQAISTAESTYGCVVSCFVTDGAANMVKARRLMNNSNENILTFGCGALGGNLLSKYICRLERFKAILDKTKEIAKYFNFHHIPNAWYRLNGGTKLKLPIGVRWNTYADHLDSILKNYHILIKVCIEHEGDKNLDSSKGKLID